MQLEVLDERHLHRDLGGNLDARAAQLRIAHGSVHVAHLQERAGHAHGQIQTRPLGDQLVVQVAAVRAHEAVDDVLAVGRGADHADHRVDGELHAVEVGHAVANGDLLRAVARHLEQRTAVVVGGDGALVGHLHLVDVHHEHVSRLGALDVHGAGGRVREPVRVVEVGHRRVLVGNAVGEAVERFEHEHLPRMRGGARRVVLRERVDLIGDDLHAVLLVFAVGASARERDDARGFSARRTSTWRTSAQHATYGTRHAACGTQHAGTSTRENATTRRRVYASTSTRRHASMPARRHADTPAPRHGSTQMPGHPNAQTPGIRAAFFLGRADARDARNANRAPLASSVRQNLVKHYTAARRFRAESAPSTPTAAMPVQMHAKHTA